MTLRQYRRLFAISGNLFALLSGGAEAASTSATVTLRANLVRPTCSVTGPTEVSLGTINTRGTTTHSPFSLAISCPYADLGAALYAEAVYPNGFSGTQVWMGSSDNSSPRLFLNEATYGGDIPFTSAGASLPANHFCAGRGTSWTCTLTPRTVIYAATRLGDARAVIRFTIAPQ